MRLNLGCGLSPRDDWTNVDITAGPGVDVVCDLDSGTLPFEDDCVDESYGSHVLEHLHRPLDFMGELWRVSKSGARAKFLLPHGGSDDAWEDPTHVRPWFPNSFAYFAQSAYWRADYGYTADWRVVDLRLDVRKAQFDGASYQELLAAVQTFRNTVKQMVVVLEAVKPAGPRERATEPIGVRFNLV